MIKIVSKFKPNLLIRKTLDCFHGKCVDLIKDVVDVLPPDLDLLVKSSLPSNNTFFSFYRIIFPLKNECFLFSYTPRRVYKYFRKVLARPFHFGPNSIENNLELFLRQAGQNFGFPASTEQNVLETSGKDKDRDHHGQDLPGSDNNQEIWI